MGFDHDLWLAVDAPLHSVYVAYQKDDSLMVVDTDKCNGAHPGVRDAQHTEIHTGADPESVVVDDQTQTLYTANEVDNDVSVIDAGRRERGDRSGCGTLRPKSRTRERETWRPTLASGQPTSRPARALWR